MTNQIVLFGAETAPNDYKQWYTHQIGNETTIAYRLETGSPLDFAGRSTNDVFALLEEILRGTAGLAVVTAHDPDGRRRVAVKTNSPTRVSAASRCVWLKPTGSFELFKLETGESPLGDWDALIIPVSAKAAKPLEAFMKTVVDLPPTIRSMVLLQLTEANFESRMTRLEIAATGRGGGALPPSKRGRFLDLSRGAWAAALVLALLVGTTWALTMQQLTGIEARLRALSATDPNAQKTSDSTAAAPSPSNAVGAAYSRPLPAGGEVKLVGGTVEEALWNALARGEGGTFELNRISFKDARLADAVATSEQLGTVAQILKAYSTFPVQITGRAIQEKTDRQKALERKRCESVRSRLQNLGIAPTQFRSVSATQGSTTDENTDATEKIVILQIPDGTS
jgi:hypothetical protein